MAGSVSSMGHNSIFVQQTSGQPAAETHPFTTKTDTFGRTIKPARMLRDGAVMVVPACRCMFSGNTSRQCDTHVGVEEAIILYPGEFQEIPEGQASRMLRRHAG